MRKRVELVFRSVGERTSDIALDLAQQHISPDRIHHISHVRPFSKAVEQMLTLPYDGDVIVFLDADCLIMEDMQPFLQRNNRPYTDCYVLDKFRHRIHCGVHITRRDVVDAMQQVPISHDNLKYVLRPESFIRNQVLQQMSGEHHKAFKSFRIFHDFHQYYRDIFVKYALRELRRAVDGTDVAAFDYYMSQWNDDDLDYEVARRAIHYTRERFRPEWTATETAAFLDCLPDIAHDALATWDISEKSPLTMDEVHAINTTLHLAHAFQRPQQKVFGIGLSRTGTKTLTKALNILGFDVIHYPIDETILSELTHGVYNLALLNDFDGITDITVAPFYAQLDRHYPNSKFILTIREKESWLSSLERHWFEKPIFEDIPGKETTMQLRRFLRAAVYGTYAFNRERMAYVYDQHLRNVQDYFRDRPESLLILNITGGEEWEPLCTFLGRTVPGVAFPNVRSASAL